MAQSSHCVNISPNQAKANVNQNTNELEIKAFMTIRKISGPGQSWNWILVLVVDYGQSKKDFKIPEINMIDKLEGSLYINL